MKTKISISIDESTNSQIDDLLKDGTFRNKSHLIELALNRFMEERK